MRHRRNRDAQRKTPRGFSAGRWYRGTPFQRRPNSVTTRVDPLFEPGLQVVPDRSLTGSPPFEIASGRFYQQSVLSAALTPLLELELQHRLDDPAVGCVREAATDADIVGKASRLYGAFGLRRVYYSAFSPIPDASAVLPLKRPPLVREHRLYQSDWLMRFYGYQPAEVMQATDADGMLPLDIDPKLAWAVKFRERFPVDVNRASREDLLRVPGLGVRAVNQIVASRRHRTLRLDDVAKLTVSIAKLRPFLVAADWRPLTLTDRADLRALLAPKQEQLELFAA